MKRSTTRWLATALLLGLNAEAVAQRGTVPAKEGQADRVHYEASGRDTKDCRTCHAAVMDPSVMDTFHLFDVSDRAAGLSLRPADEALRAQLSLAKNEGLVVTSLEVHGPASLAGVEQDDVLLAAGETSLAKADDLEAALKSAGEKPTSLVILRRGERLRIKVQPQVRVTLGPVRPEPPSFWLGVSVSPLEPALRSQLKLPQNRGLLALEIIKDSPAAKAGMKTHDILLTLDKKPLDSQEKLVELVQSNGDKSVPLELIREGKTQTVSVTPGRRNADQRKPSAYETANAWTVNAAIPLLRWEAKVLPHGQGNPNLATLLGVDRDGQMDLLTAQGFLQRETHDDAGAVSKRLDDLGAEIKQLRKAIEELNKALKERK